MTKAEELLDSLSEDQVMTYIDDPASEPHIVINSDRTVTVPDELKHIAVRGDHNIETVTFDGPRYWDGHDLSEMKLRVVFQRPDGYRDSHPVENLCIDTVDESVIHFDWTISGNATAIQGSISFTVCGKLSDAEGVVEREWHTRLNQDLVVDEGMDCSSEEIIEQNPDIIEAILVQLDDIRNTGGVSDEQIDNALSAYMERNHVGSVYYRATDYGISTESEDNTPALQALVERLSAAGGGIIFFPVGVYNFKYNPNKQGGYAFHERAVHMKSNVSIVGENLEKTILKQTTNAPYSLFYFIGTPDTPITGCHFSNFTVDAYGTGDDNAVYGKAFFFQYVRDCVFRDLRLMGTVATAMGIDFLDRVVIDNVSCIDCGRTFTGSEAGTSGIGIGTAGWENENFIVTNCVCEGCGQYGIFIENQGLFGDGNVDYAKGCIISNCIVRNGLNKGIGVRGGQNVTVIGCEAYENTSHGIYVDNNCRDIKVVSCSSNGNGAAGIHIEPNAQSVRIAVRGCHCADNEMQGIAVNASSMSLGLIGNYTAGNSVGLEIADILLIDCAIKGNILFDGDNVRAVFRGDNKFNDFADIIADIQTTSITADMYTEGYKIDPDGSLSAAASAHTTLQYIDVSRLSDSFKFVYDNPSGNSVRIAQYNSNRVSLGDAFEMNWQTSNPASITVDKLDGCKYIRISTSNGIAVGELEWDADPDADVIKSSTITADMYTEGYKLNPDGSAAEQSEAYTILAYIDVSALGNSFDFTFSNPSGMSVRIAQYDANKASLSDSSEMTWHNDNPATMSITKLSGCRYIRVSTLYGIAVGELKSTDNEIRTTTITADMYTEGKKIMPDGSLTEESGTYSIIEYIDVSELPDVFAFAIGDARGTAVRIAQYDASKASLSASFELTGVSSSTGSVTINKLSGCKYIRIFSSTAPTAGQLSATLPE